MRPTIALAVLLLPSVAFASPSLPDWHLRAAVGESVSQQHGSVLELALTTPVSSDVSLGMESGVGYMRASRPTGERVYTASPGAVLGGLTDGITRHRAFYLAPMIRVGASVHLIASYGLYDLFDTQGSPAYVQGASVGLGVGGAGRLQPSAELRLRYASDHPFSPDATLSGTSLSFTMGISI